jgi:hypothetical protein
VAVFSKNTIMLIVKWGEMCINDFYFFVIKESVNKVELGTVMRE